MTISKLDAKAAKKLLRRICKAISISCGTKVAPNYYSDGMVNIVSEDREIAALESSGKLAYEMFFANANDLLEKLLTPNAVLHFSPLGKEEVKIYASKMFGTTLEEVNVKLDLMKVQS